jgi:hypothetical protein
MCVLNHTGASGVPSMHNVLISSVLKGGEECIHLLHLVGHEPKTDIGLLD